MTEQEKELLSKVKNKTNSITEIAKNNVKSYPSLYKIGLAALLLIPYIPYRYDEYWSVLEIALRMFKSL